VPGSCGLDAGDQQLGCYGNPFVWGRRSLECPVSDLVRVLLDGDSNSMVASRQDLARAGD
jgi:hypothetical protein